MNTPGFQNMMGTGPVGMAQPQGQQQPMVPMAIQAKLIQHYTAQQQQQQAQMPMDWRSTIQPKERAGLVMELCVYPPQVKATQTLTDIISRRTGLRLAKPELPEAQATQSAIRIEEQCLRSHGDRVSLNLTLLTT